jgi:two-component system sensor histidine kinase MprB
MHLTSCASLRTNIELLARARRLSSDDQERLIADVRTQVEELSLLVGDVVDLARGEEPPATAYEVRLDELIAAAVERARRHRPAVEFSTLLEPTIVIGVPERLDRAVANVLDNAAKWSPAGGQVEVVLSDGECTVRDGGPGIAAADLPHVFDRFYRAADARDMPGSGLGLAIVRQIIDAHGGTIAVESPVSGGTIVRFRLPRSSGSPPDQLFPDS